MFLQLMSCGFPEGLLRRQLGLKRRRLRMLSREASRRLSRLPSLKLEAGFPDRPEQRLSFEFHHRPSRPGSRP